MNTVDFEFPIALFTRVLLPDAEIIDFLGMLATIQSPSQLEMCLLRLLASQSCKISDLKNTFSFLVFFFFFFTFIILTVKVMLLNDFNVGVCICN